MPETSIGGAIVRRRFRFGGELVSPGDLLNRAELDRMPQANRKALLDNHYIEPYSTSTPEDTQRHIIHLSGGKYDVIEGVKLNPAPLTKEQATALANVAVN